MGLGLPGLRAGGGWRVDVVGKKRLGNVYNVYINTVFDGKQPAQVVGCYVFRTR